MRVVLVHGINNQDSSERAIIDEWLDALSHSLAPTDMAKVRRAEFVAPHPIGSASTDDAACTGAAMR